MAPKPGDPPRLVEDLEKELVCSICTELLYQPLTLLDCLHTFCGSCLKEWFSVQHSRRRSSQSSVRYTCPSCRAMVRGTRPNATVTTLLDMFLATNPDRVKSDAEKEEVAKRYKPGDSVIPSESSSSDTEEPDSEVVEEVRHLSLQESRNSGRRLNYRERQQSSASGHARGSDTEDGRLRRRPAEEREARRQARQRAQRAAASAEDALESSRRARHQSSLRSLLSLSDVETMEEEILRQIIEDGLLDGIDLDHLSPAQEEELSERIADAYRQRHRLRSRSQRTQESTQPAQGRSSRSRASSQSAQAQVPATAAAPHETTATRNHAASDSSPLLGLPLSRSRDSDHQRNLSDQGGRRRRPSPLATHHASSSAVDLRPAARSASDMTSDRVQTSQLRRVEAGDRPARRSRRATESEQVTPNMFLAGTRERAQTTSRPSTSSSTTAQLRSPYRTFAPSRSEVTLPIPASQTTLDLSMTHRDGRSTSSSRSPRTPTALYPEPSISFHCLECNEGDYDICANCYFKLVAWGKISKENGHNGWRRCLRGHRMVVVGFETHEEGQKRVVVRGLVGGHALRDEYALHQQQQQQHASTPTSATFSGSNTVIPSPEIGSGDWSWKEGPERRKKASRVRSALSASPTFFSSPHSRRPPPDGGIGLIVHARWSWFPEEDIKDELMFPRGAEITEAENINDDWFWGCYAGVTGLFPGAHVVVVGEVV
ncbi:hypothetical protein MPDQ_006944 [Monascus purpureus]|uniref:RING-type domain-containing protein n=1 Tax=Monascus purpureus TaxID=5098 RepID=A0A507QT75_MONPU|nr:hypothetical protein MPDQ_006944 [Monascus purpureus]